MDLVPLLNAHAYLLVERPPEVWDVDVEDEAVTRMLGEMIAAALVRGTPLELVILRVANVVVEIGDANGVPSASTSRSASSAREIGARDRLAARPKQCGGTGRHRS